MEDIRMGCMLLTHKRQDVVDYRQAFVLRFKEYDRRFHAWDDAGNELPCPSGFAVPGAINCFHLILVTHNELTFHQNDQWKIYWGHPGGATPKPKGEGVSLMISDFLTSEWARLRDNDRCVVAASPSSQTHTSSPSKAQIIFQPGKSRQGWFTLDHLLAQVDNAIDIFNNLTRGYAQVLFLFNNALNHHKCADDAISAWNMVKGAPVLFFFFSLFSLP